MSCNQSNSSSSSNSFNRPSDLFSSSSSSRRPIRARRRPSDSVDDGFLSHYRGTNDQGSVNRDKAEDALDAVDRLFGGKAKNRDRRRMGREKWLEDVTARGMTKEEKETGEVMDVETRDDTGFDEAKVEGTKPHVSFSDEKVFQNLMDIARKGPEYQGASRKRDSVKKRRDEKRGRAKKDPSTNRANVEVMKLLGLTKKASEPDLKDDHKVEELNTGGFRSQGRKRPDDGGPTKYLGVRRVGGQTHRILTSPTDWLPMGEELVDKVRSDGRSLGGRGTRGKGVVTDCRKCKGTGLETCSACLGTGWIPPLSDPRVKGKRRAVLEKMWSQPNLVVDSFGEAQCLKCNGLGKQFCGKCKGSGSADHVGFNLRDLREIFDIFDDVDDSMIEDEFESEEFAEDEEEEDTIDEFSLFTGGVEEEGENDGEKEEEEEEEGMMESEVEVFDEDMEVEDESAELKAALEAMHVADTENEPMSYIERMRQIDAAMDEDEDEDLIVQELEDGNGVDEGDDFDILLQGDDEDEEEDDEDVYGDDHEDELE